MRWSCLAVLPLLTACGSASEQGSPSEDIIGTDSGAGGAPAHVDSGRPGGGGVLGTGGGGGGVGGARATGGGTGSGGAQQDAAPHVVRPCGADGSVGAVGVWEDITPPQTPLSNSLGTTSAAVNPLDPATVYVSVTVNQWQPGAGVYKSTDCGATWAKANTGRNAAQVDSGNGWQIIIDPVDPNVMYVINGYGGPPSLFKSTDAGTDWDATFPDKGVVAEAIGGNFTQAVSMDPTDHDHLVVTFHFNCSGTYAPMCMAESKDAGASWRIFKGPGSGWSEGANPIVLGSTTWLYSEGGGVHYTSDSGATWEKVAPGGNGQIYRAADGTMYLGSNGAMLRSTDGHAWTSISGSPRATGLIGDGENLFAVFQNDWSGQPYYTAKEAEPTTWTKISTPTIHAGASFLAYDKDHHILYGPSWGGGLWRVVTR
jgi:hypothetical protein